MKTCQTCHGEGSVPSTIEVARKYWIKALAAVARAMLVVAVTPVGMMLCIGLAKLALYAIGAPEYVSLRPDTSIEPSDVLKAGAIIGVFAGVVGSALLGVDLWPWFREERR